LNKNKLKIILNAQCNEYEELIDQYPDIGVKNFILFKYRMMYWRLW